METDIRKRMAWIRLYRIAGVVCRRCGVSRPTLRKWLRRYEQGGSEALVSRSRRPHTHPGSRIDRQIEAMIVDMRMDRRFGVRRLQSELDRYFELSELTPFWENVEQNYHQARERYRYPVYLVDQAMVDVKRSL